VGRGGEPEIFARQTCDMNIIQIKFSPIDSMRLISCGKENIRFWRVSPTAGEYGVRSIRGKAVALGSDLSRGFTFTALDFEFPVRQTNDFD
jgi:WD repeat-containing protein 90